MKRGFKSKAEKLAVEYRNFMKIHPCAKLCAFQLANHLNIEVKTISSFSVSIADPSVFNREFSACNIKNSQGNFIIIYNSNHDPKRQQSDIMHEICHIICKHEVSYDTNYTLPTGLRILNPEHEEEANCMCYTFLLPKPAIFWAIKRNMTAAAISEHFQVSESLVNFRLGITGLSKRLGKFPKLQ